MSDDWITFAADLKRCMFLAKITNRALAAEAGYTEAYVSELLNGRGGKMRGNDESRFKLIEALDRLEAKQQETARA